MGEERTLHFGLYWDADTSSLSESSEKTAELREEAETTAESLEQIGANMEGIGADVSNALDQMGGAGANAGMTIRDAMLQSANAGDGLFKMLDVGIGTAFKNGVAHAKQFGVAASGTAKGTVTAFQNPVQFIKDKVTGAFKNAGDQIKGKLVDALSKAKKGADESGDAAKKAGDDYADMGKRGTGGVEGLIGSIKRLATAALGIVALKKGAEIIKNFMMTATNAAANAEETQSKFDVVFKDASGGAEQWVANFSAAAKRSSVEIKGFMADSQAMFTGLGMAVDPAAEMSRAMTSLSYDLASFHNLNDQDAFDKLQSGLMGQTQGLKSMGIVLNETSLKQAMATMKLKGNFDALDEQTKVQVRFNAILAQTADAQTDVTRTTDSYTNGLKGVKGMWADFLANAGAKFTPVFTRMFNVILEKWPTIEPILMKVVDVLANGLEQAIPILLDLGTQLLPILTSALAAVLEIATPIIPVFMQLVQAILPPLVSLISVLATSLLPPFVQILDVLNTAVIQPLLPLFQQIIEALLPAFVAVLGVLNPLIAALSPLLTMVAQILVPIAGIFGQFVQSLLPPIMNILNVIFVSILQPLLPIIQMIAMSILPVIAQVLGLIAPILQLIAPVLQAISPIIEFIGKILGFIVDVISKIIGWVANGIGKVVNFFASLFGGAKTANEETGKLADNMADVTKAGEAYTPPAYEVPPPIPAPVIPPPEPLPPIAVPPMMPPDTQGYQTKIDATYSTVNTTSADTYKDMTQHSDDAWHAMVAVADTGAQQIVEAFGRMRDAAGSLTDVGIQVTMGSVATKMPHNARGTDNFDGGWTHINEEGGEIAFLPDGTTIVPADKSERLISTQKTSSKVFAPTYNVHLSGKASEEDKREIEELIRRVSREEYEQFADEDAFEEAYQESL